MLYKRIEASTADKPQWADFKSPIVVTYNYKLIHSATEMTPNEARQPDNSLNAKVNMELKAKHSRKYPEIKVGYMVRVNWKKPQAKKTVFRIGVKQPTKKLASLTSWANRITF